MTTEKLTPAQAAWMKALNLEAVRRGLPDWPCEEIERRPSCWIEDFARGKTPAQALAENYGLSDADPDAAPSQS